MRSIIATTRIADAIKIIRFVLLIFRWIFFISRDSDVKVRLNKKAGINLFPTEQDILPTGGIFFPKTGKNKNQQNQQPNNEIPIKERLFFAFVF